MTATDAFLSGLFSGIIGTLIIALLAVVFVITKGSRRGVPTIPVQMLPRGLPPCLSCREGKSHVCGRRVQPGVWPQYDVVTSTGKRHGPLSHDIAVASLERYRKMFDERTGIPRELLDEARKSRAPAAREPAPTPAPPPKERP